MPIYINANTGTLNQLVFFSEIQSGQFAKEWMQEHKSGQTKFKVMRKQQAEHPIEAVGEKLRTLMPWIAEGKMVDKSKN